MPKACMMDGREADLIPDWLKLKMIRSEVTPLVDAALVELDPTKLVLFIQSFGIPVARYTSFFFHYISQIGQYSRVTLSWGKNRFASEL